ncbi:hypothetical protein H3C70_05215 [Patescibacteria group bacterium]|nr:hypothetical protein [Patescibacteria group bacterium]
MKKYIPFVFPALALAIVVFLGYRWYTSQTMRSNGQITDFAQGVEVEELSTEQVDKLKPTGAQDIPSVEMTGEGETAGQVRYEIADGKVAFTVSADLAAPTGGSFYQVWLKEVGGESKKKAFRLEAGKGGFVGWGAISADTLPFEVVVSREINDDDQLEETVLTATVQQ